MVYSALPNSDILVDASVTVCPIHSPGLFKLFWERPSAITQQFEGWTS